MANDPQPKGFITVHEGFERYCNAATPANLPTAELARETDMRVERMLEAYSDAELDCEIFPPDSPTSYIVPMGLWRGEGFPSRVFHSDDVHAFEGQPGWEPYHGRTAFVSERALMQWIDEETRPIPETVEIDPADFDPLKEPSWSFIMALAWISWRDIEAVRRQMPEYCIARGWPGDPSTATVLENDHEIDGEYQDPSDRMMVFHTGKAINDLRRAGEMEELTVYAVDETGEAVALSRLDWTRGRQEIGTRFDDCWRVGNRFYHGLFVYREELLRAFPAQHSNQPATREQEHALVQRIKNAMTISPNRCMGWAAMKQHWPEAAMMGRPTIKACIINASDNLALPANSAWRQGGATLTEKQLRKLGLIDGSQQTA